MSIRVMSRVWESSKAKSGDLLVLLAIADFSNDDGVAWPSVPTLATKGRLSTRQTKRALANLARLGELSVRKNKGPHGANLYRVTLGDNLSPGQKVMVTSAASGGDIHDTDWVTPMSPNPSSESSVKKNRHSLSGEFLKVWGAFPRKQNQGGARKAWDALDPDYDLVAEMLKAIHRAKRSEQWQRDRGRFIPTLEKWLRNESWHDELPLSVWETDLNPNKEESK